MAQQVVWEDVQPISVRELLEHGKTSELPALLRVRDAQGRLAELCALLKEAPQLRGLSLLEGRFSRMRNQVGAAEVAALGALTRLTTLDLTDCWIGVEGTQALAQKDVLGALTQLTTLNLTR